MHIDSMPLYSRLADGLEITPEQANPPRHGSANNPDDGVPPGIDDAPAIRPANQGISTAMLGGVLSMTVAIATGIIIGNNSAFKLKVSTDTQARERLAEATATAAPAGPAHAQPVRATPAPTLPSLSISKVETHRAVRKPLAQSRRKADGSKVAGRKKKTQLGRTTRPNPSGSMVHTTPNRTTPTAQSAAAQIEQIQPSPIRNLAAQYARCAQLQGFLRRERCKWEVCGDKWGKQGCPSYKHNPNPEIGAGNLDKDVIAGAVADS